MQYAVIKTGGKQYRVSEKDTIEVDRLSDSTNESVTFNDVLLVVSDNKATIGKPTIPGASVLAKVIAQTKGEKIRVSKYKAKVRYRRTTGFRSFLTKVHIEQIKLSNGISKSETKEKVVPVKAKKKKSS